MVILADHLSLPTQDRNCVPKTGVCVVERGCKEKTCRDVETGIFVGERILLDIQLCEMYIHMKTDIVWVLGTP